MRALRLARRRSGECTGCRPSLSLLGCLCLLEDGFVVPTSPNEVILEVDDRERRVQMFVDAVLDEEVFRNRLKESAPITAISNRSP